MMEHRHIISTILEDIGYTVMSRQALFEENPQILFGYVALLKMEAKKDNSKQIIERLNSHGLLQ